MTFQPVRIIHLLLIAALLALSAAPERAFAEPAKPMVMAAQTVAKPASGKARQRAADPAGRAGLVDVYLIRGFLGVFSLGMDQLNRSLVANGVSTKIVGHLSWRRLADEIAAEQARNPKHPVVLVGHSFGANAALMLAKTLGDKGIRTTLVVTVDPTVGRPVSPAVRRYLNIYQANNGLGVALDPAPNVDNDNARDRSDLVEARINHFSMDENESVQRHMLTEIMKVVRR